MFVTRFRINFACVGDTDPINLCAKFHAFSMICKIFLPFTYTKIIIGWHVRCIQIHSSKECTAPYWPMPTHRVYTMPYVRERKRSTCSYFRLQEYSKKQSMFHKKCSKMYKYSKSPPPPASSDAPQKVTCFLYRPSFYLSPDIFSDHVFFSFQLQDNDFWRCIELFLSHWSTFIIGPQKTSTYFCQRAWKLPNIFSIFLQGNVKLNFWSGCIIHYSELMLYPAKIRT